MWQRCRASLLCLGAPQFGSAQSGLALWRDEGQLPHKFSFILWITLTTDVIWEFGTDRMCKNGAWKLHLNSMLLPCRTEKCNLKGSIYQGKSSEAVHNTQLLSRVVHVACLSQTKSKLCVIHSYRKSKRSKHGWGCTTCCLFLLLFPSLYCLETSMGKRKIMEGNSHWKEVWQGFCAWNTRKTSY